MGTSSPSRGPLSGRFLGRLFALVLALTVTGWLAAQNSKKEEVEDTTKAKKPVPEVEDDVPAKAKKKVPEVEDDVPAKPRKPVKVEEEKPKGAKPPVKPAAPAPAEAQTSLAEALRETKNPALQELYGGLKVPHDAFTVNSIGDRSVTYNIEPLTHYYAGEQPHFKSGIVRIWTYDQEWRRAKNYVEYNHALRIRPYEEIALDDVETFLRKDLDKRPDTDKLALSRADMLAAAETVLAAVDRWHASARETGERKGEEWDPLRQRLRERLFRVQMDRLDTFVKAGDWDGASSYARTLADAYRDQEERRREIAGKLVGLIQDELRKNADETQLKEARNRFRMLEEVFPGNLALKPIIDSLRATSEQLLNEAKSLTKAGQHQKAQEKLDLARELFPNLPELAEEMAKLERDHPILRVGGRDLPVNTFMFPGQAVTDADQRAVELMFEGLVKLRVEPGVGQRYEPALAAGVPVLVPLGREFRIARDAAWSDGTPVTVGDVKETLRAMRQEGWPGHSPMWGRLIEDAEGGGDAFRLSLRLRQGYLDPLSLMTFKVMRQKTLQAMRRPDAAPDGSGPFRYAGRTTSRVGAAEREAARFIANPGYGSRLGKLNLPRIRDIYFVRFPEGTKGAAEALRANPPAIDLLLDLSAKEAAGLRGAGNVTVRGPMANRRVYFLAVNHRGGALKDNAPLRRAIAFAVNREDLLNKHFRSEAWPKAHHALNGPYPAGSWPCDPKVPAELYAPERAKHEVREAVKEAGGPVKLKLEYPSDDPSLKDALEDLCKSVNEVLRIDERTFIELELQAVEPHRLREDVERTHNYELAYYHYDHPSEAYWIAPLFDMDPSAIIANGSNYLGYIDGDLQSMLVQAQNHRDFSEVRQATNIIHRMLYEKMPLIPLWQLDTFLAHRSGVNLERAAIDPLLIFNDVEHWTMDGKR